MANWHSIQKHIDRGKGFAARRLSQPYNVFRVTGASSGDWLDPANMVAQNVLAAYRKGITNDKGLETAERRGTFWYEVVGNMDPFLLGDVFIQNDPIYDKGATSVTWPQTDQFNGLALAGHHPLKKVFAGRVDRLVSIFRPASVPDSNNYFTSTISGAQPLVLIGGIFQLGEVTDTPAKVPAGFGALYRPFGGNVFLDSVPGMTKMSLWYAFVPALNGFTFREGDRLVEGNGCSYVVFNPWNQEAGIVGHQLVCERERAQD